VHDEQTTNVQIVAALRFPNFGTLEFTKWYENNITN